MRGVLALTLLASTSAFAQRAATTDALERVGEVLQPAIQDGSLQGLSPVMVVGARPAFEATQAWFPTAAIVALADAFGRTNLRACEACMQPRVNVADGRLEYSSMAISLEEIIAIDTNTRGQSAPACSWTSIAAWEATRASGISSALTVAPIAAATSNAIPRREKQSARFGVSFSSKPASGRPR